MLTVTITNTIMSKTRNAGGGGGIPPSNTVAPVISGTNVVGSTLSSTTGTWIGTPTITYAYQWKRNGSNIASATSSTYTLVQADATFAITCAVTATNVVGSAEATSNSLTIIDADANAFLTAAVITNTTQVNAVNQLTVDLKNASIWTKMKAVYPFVGGTATTHKWNLKNPLDTNAAFRLTFTGGWTHSSTGALPNGTNGYADTFLNINTSLSINSHAINYYANTNSDSTNRGNYGGFTTAGNSLDSYGLSSTLYFRSGVSSPITTPSNNKGFFGITRISSANFNTINEDGTYVTTSGASYTSVNRSIYLGTINPTGTTGYSVQSFAFFSICDGLTQAEMTSLRTAVINYQITLGRYVGVPIVSDSDAQAFINAAYIINNTQANAVNQLVIDMKAANIWTKMKAIYPFVGGTATNHKWNLKDPQDTNAAFRLVFNGGWTHSSTGALPNGTNAFANTFLNALTDLTISTNSSFGVYVAGTATASKAHIGYIESTNKQFYLHTQSLTEKRGNTASSASAAYFMSKTGLTATTQRGFWAASNRSATDRAMICSDGSFVVSTASHNVTQASFTLFIGALNSLGTSVQYDTMEQRFAFIGTALNNTELTSLRTAVTTFETTLSRQV